MSAEKTSPLALLLLWDQELAQIRKNYSKESKLDVLDKLKLKRISKEIIEMLEENK